MEEIIDYSKLQYAVSAYDRGNFQKCGHLLEEALPRRVQLTAFGVDTIFDFDTEIKDLKRDVRMAAASVQVMRDLLLARPADASAAPAVTVNADLIAVAAWLHDHAEYIMCASTLEAAVPEELREDFFPDWHWDREMEDLRAGYSLATENSDFLEDYTDITAEREAPEAEVDECADVYDYIDFPYGDPITSTRVAEIAAKIFGGDTRAVNDLFRWRETPQGQSHWDNIYDGITAITVDDAEYILGYIAYLQQKEAEADPTDTHDYTSVQCSFPANLRETVRQLQETGSTTQSYICGFEWDTTPQGYTYWEPRFVNRTYAFSEEDIAYISGFLDYVNAQEG